METGPTTSHISRLHIYWEKTSAIKIYRREVCVFLFVNTISVELIFHIIAKKRICKFVPLN